jgi:hypothetical protein
MDTKTDTGSRAIRVSGYSRAVSISPVILAVPQQAAVKEFHSRGFPQTVQLLRAGRVFPVS